MRITKIKRSDMTINDFISRKKEKKFKEIRFKSKSVNFSLEFNTSGISFAEQTLKPEWSLQEIEKYLIDNRLTNKPYDLYKNEVAKKRKLDLEFCKYWAVANDIKKKFFEKYEGLKSWIDNQINFAEENGYVKSTFGCIRRLPQLLYKGDREHDSGTIKNLQNISVNTVVQNFEIAVAQLTLIETNKWLKENNMKSRIFSATHDSMDFYYHKSELKQLISKVKEIVERDLPEYQGIPMEIEWDIADYEKGEYWGMGKEIKFDKL